MAGVSLLALLDDIASVLDDVAVLTKVAARKTAGVLGDDLALNAEQVSGVVAERELPVVWAVAKGSFVNKLILVPAALVISAFIPWLVTPLLMLGGAYLCFEGAEKVLHRFFPSNKEHSEKDVISGAEEGLAGIEKRKIKGAVRTDFVLSAEIIVIALGSVPDDASLTIRAIVLSLIGLSMTIGVYGLVAAIVKLDDAGLYLMRNHKAGRPIHTLGTILVGASPKLMRFLTVAGTIAMFMVGGGILAHGLPWLRSMTELVDDLPMAALLNASLNTGIGIFSGGLLFLLVSLTRQFWKKTKPTAS